MVLYRNIFSTKTSRQLFEQKNRQIKLMLYKSQLNKLEQSVNYNNRRGFVYNKNDLNYIRFLRQKITNLQK